MTTAVLDEQILLTVNARAAAVSWLNAFLAAGEDPERPILYRNLSLEFYDTGLQLIGCNGTALFRCWVSSTGEDEWPGPRAKPTRSVIAMDPDGFGIGFMKALLRVASQDGHTHEQLAIATAEGDEEAAPSLGPQFQTERLILRACGQRIDLRTYQDKYPDWRKLNLGLAAYERVDGLTLAPGILARVGKLKDVQAVDLSFHGNEKMIDFVARGSATEVRGMLAPMRRPEKKADREGSQAQD